MRRIRRTWVLGTVVLCLLGALASIASGASHHGGASLVAAARQAAEHGARHTRGATFRVLVIRRHGRWAYGTVVMIPGGKRSHDEGGGTPSTFLARERHGRWDVALQGTSAFKRYLRLAPVSVISTEERKLAFAAEQSAVSRGGSGPGGEPAFALPWAAGQTWALWYGPHNTDNDYGPHPYTSLDFSGGDGIVRAAASGVVYRPCSNLVVIDHGGGWETGYYHMPRIFVRAGQYVHTGDELGTTGTGVGCGGVARGAHVHFSIYHFATSGVQNVFQTPSADMNGDVIGDWQVFDGARSGLGYMKNLKTGQVVYPSDTEGSGAIYNDGTVGGGKAVVPTGYFTLAAVSILSGPGTSYSVVGSLPNGAAVNIVCQTRGTPVNGSSIWDEIAAGQYIADWYVSTPEVGQFTPGIPQCTNSQPTANSPYGPSLAIWPSGTRNPAGQQDVFWKGSGNNGLWEAVWNNGWYGPSALPAINNAASAPSAVINAPRDEEDVWWEGTDSQLYIQYWAGQWYGPVRLGMGPLGSGPSGAVWPSGTRNPAGQEDVFWHGAGNNGLWEAIFTPGSGWSGPYELPNISNAASAPSAVINAARDEEDVWWEGTDGQLYIQYWNGQWNGPVQLGMGPLGSAPSGAVWPSGTRNPAGQEDVFWKGSGNNGLWEAIFSPSSGWSGPYQVPGVNNVASAPTAVINGPRDEEDIFWKGTDNQLWETEWAGGWVAPHAVGMGPLG
jgi:LasA protease